jgi:hypothetical protein
VKVVVTLYMTYSNLQAKIISLIASQHT